MWAPTANGTRIALFLAFIAMRVTAAENSKNAVTASDDPNDDTGALAPLPEVDVALGKKWRFELPSELEAGFGYLSGDNIHTESGAVFVLEVETEPTFAYRKRKVRLRLPLKFDERETVGFDLAERHVQGGGECVIRPAQAWELGVTGGAGWFSKPRWADPYQPELDVADNRTGRLLPTDRYSYFHADAGASVERRLNRKLSLELYSAYYFQNNVEDPNYDEIDTPTHLVPGDRDRTRGGLQLTGHTDERFWRYAIDGRADWIRYRRASARDAGDGLTHAALGGEPANPKQRFLQLRLRMRNSLKLIEDLLKLVAAVEYTRNMDVFQGYYTWNQIEGDFSFHIAPMDRLLLETGYFVAFRRYTRDGYQEASNHPALDNGDTIRANLLHVVNGRVELSVFFKSLKLFADVRFAHNTTNFPDYEPGIFPAGSAYRIDWDYINLHIIGGLLLET